MWRRKKSIWQRNKRGVVRQALVEGVPEEIWLDTGSAQTLVRRDLVLEARLLVERTAVVRCGHRVSVRYPLAELEITVGEKTMTVRAGVLDHLPVQLYWGTMCHSCLAC